MTIRSLDVARAYDIVKIMTDGGPAGRTELLWTLVARTAYSDARMGLANADGAMSRSCCRSCSPSISSASSPRRAAQIGAEW